jgi:hypothetical protein
MTQLQKIVAKAKSLRKSNPNTKWTDLIKKASKLVTPAKKSVSGIKRTIVKKSAPAIPLIKKRIVSRSDFAMAGVKKKKATKKADSKTKIGYKSDRIDQLKKTTPYIRKYKKEGFSRKDAIKNAMLDAGYMSGTKTHKDTKSHNVNIRVMSGMNGSEQFVKQLNSLLADKKKLESDLNIYKQRKKENVKFSSFNALHFKRLPSMIKSVNTQIREAKKHIK